MIDLKKYLLTDFYKMTYLTYIRFASYCILLFTFYSCHPYQVINENKSTNYYFNFFKTNVHYIPMGNWFELGDDKIDSIDIKTVEILGQNYMKDRTHVYFKSVLIKNADVQSFKILCSDNASFARDKNRIYYESNSFQNINADSVVFPGGACGPVLKDNKYVYTTYPVKYIDKGNAVILPIPGVAAETYQYINDLYGKDTVHVYYKGIPMKDAEPKTFILLKEYYAKDSNHVYYDGLNVDGLDANTFALITGGQYCKDKKGVYYGLDATYNEQGEPLRYAAKQVIGADPESFVMIQSDKIDYAKDKTKYYWGGKAQ